MVKKPTKKVAITDIDNLHACIAADQKQLEKTYHHAVTLNRKNMAVISKSLVKAKKDVVKAKRNKKKAPKAHQVATSQVATITDALASLKSISSRIELGYKKFLAEQKLMSKFEKEWNKKHAAKRPKKRSKPAKKANKLEFIQLHNE